MKQSKEILNSLKVKDSAYKCLKCRDMTFVIGEEGEAIACECRALREAEYILKKSGISNEFREKTFSNFNYSFNIQTIEAYKKASSYIRSFEDIERSRNNSIIFMGQVGSGKTHLSLAIANELMDSSIGVIYMGYRDVVTKIKQNIMDEVYYNRVMGRYKNARVLLIDDLFKGKLSESDINIMFELINHRYFNNLPIIVSTELRIETLLDIDEAVGSRILEMCKGSVVEMKGKKLNYRING